MLSSRRSGNQCEGISTIWHINYKSSNFAIKCTRKFFSIDVEISKLGLAFELNEMGLLSQTCSKFSFFQVLACLLTALDSAFLLTGFFNF